MKTKRSLRMLALTLAAVVLLAVLPTSLNVRALENDLATAQSQGVVGLTQEQLDLVESLRTWQGPALTKSRGVNYGPSGKECYYTLDMTNVIRNLQRNGFWFEYWVRADGVKMYGPFVLCAVNFELHPLGTLVETSVGIGIAADTGGFAVNDPTMVDIATAW